MTQEPTSDASLDTSKTQMLILACPHCGAKNACRLDRGEKDVARKRVRCFRCRTSFPLGEARKAPAVRRGQKANADQLRLVGQTLGKFYIERIAGVGGIGAVYLARDTMLKRPVALKVLPAWASEEDPVQFKRFMLEAQTAARLVHPHVVPIYQIEQADGYWTIAMEYMGGGAVAQQILNNTPLEPALATQMILQACDALIAAHDEGIVHRDIKPANLLLTLTGTLKVGDFGLAKLNSAAARLTPGKRLIGTPNYMSPEQCRGEETSALSDIYSLGGTYYSLLSGRLPFDAENVSGFIHKHLTAPPPDVSQAVQQVPADIGRIIQQAMAKAPQDRFGDVSAMRSAIVDAMPDDWREAVFAYSLSGQRSSSALRVVGNDADATTLDAADSVSSEPPHPLDDATVTTRLEDVAPFGFRVPPFAPAQHHERFAHSPPFAATVESVRAYLAGGECLVLVEGQRGSGRSFATQMAIRELPVYRSRDPRRTRVRYFRGRRIEESVDAPSAAAPITGTLTLTNVETVRAESEAPAATTPLGSPATSDAARTASQSKSTGKTRFYRGRPVIDTPPEPEPTPPPRSADPPSSVFISTATTCVNLTIDGRHLQTRNLVDAVLGGFHLESPRGQAGSYSERAIEAILEPAEVTPMVVVIERFESLLHRTIVDLIALARIGARLGGKLRIVAVGTPGSSRRLIEALPNAADTEALPLVTAPPLSRSETAAYVAHRVRDAGRDDAELMFTPAAIAVIDDVADGRVRRINVLAHAALAFAAEHQHRKVTAAVALAASHRLLSPDEPLDADWADIRRIGLRGRLARAVVRTNA